MTGRFIAVVGPSGVGKDSVMEGLAAVDPNIVLARRVITRNPQAGGEDFEGVSVEVFEARAWANAFALHWSAHGLHYAIPLDVDAQLARGRDVMANLSRNVLTQARQRFDRFEVISLVANREVLARRLAMRGRESAQDIAQRLDRITPPLPVGLTVHEVDNSGALDDTVTAVRARLYPVRA